MLKCRQNSVEGSSPCNMPRKGSRSSGRMWGQTRPSFGRCRGKFGSGLIASARSNRPHLGRLRGKCGRGSPHLHQPLRDSTRIRPRTAYAGVGTNSSELGPHAESTRAKAHGVDRRTDIQCVRPTSRVAPMLPPNSTPPTISGSSGARAGEGQTSGPRAWRTPPSGVHRQAGGVSAAASWRAAAPCAVCRNKGYRRASTRTSTTHEAEGCHASPRG